jgi:uncharacterized surface protein with fasciclin (FAS1) repeats
MGEKLFIIDTAIRSGIFQTFTRLLEGSSLEAQLRRPTCFTLFAPADIAFAYVTHETLNQLVRASCEGILADVLAYHVVPGRYLSTQLSALSKLETASGKDLIITNTGELRIEGARLLQTDIHARNGVIHVIDRLLLPAQRAATTSA